MVNNGFIAWFAPYSQSDPSLGISTASSCIQPASTWWLTMANSWYWYCQVLLTIIKYYCPWISINHHQRTVLSHDMEVDLDSFQQSFRSTPMYSITIPEVMVTSPWHSPKNKTCATTAATAPLARALPRPPRSSDSDPAWRAALELLMVDEGFSSQFGNPQLVMVGLFL